MENETQTKESSVYKFGLYTARPFTTGCGVYIESTATGKILAIMTRHDLRRALQMTKP